MTSQQRKTLSRFLLGLSALIFVGMCGLSLVGLFTESGSTDEPALEELLTPSSDAPQTTQDPVEDDGGFLGMLWSAVMSVWNFFGRLGIVAQVLCCLILPALFVIGALND